MSDKTTPLDFDTWWAYYETLKGTPWEDDDIDLLRFYKNEPASGPSIAAAEALKYVYDRAKEWEGPVDPEDGVAATMNAVHEFAAINGWAPLWLKEMADHFAAFHKEMDDPMQDWLDEHHGYISLDWLTDHAREEVSKGVQKESEIWVTEGPAGVWVFNKPGRKS